MAQADLQRRLGQVDVLQAQAAHALRLGRSGDADVVESHLADGAGQANVDRAIRIQG